MYIPTAHHHNPIPPTPKWQRALVVMIILTIAAIILSYLPGCYTPAKAKRQALRAMTSHPEQVLPEMRKLAPCITVTVDTFYTTVDTTITVDCPDTTAAQYFTVHDTITRSNTIRVPYRVTLPARTVVKYIKDSAEIMEANLRITRLNKEREQALQREQATADKLSKARRTRNWLWLVVLACAAIITRKAWLPRVGSMVNPFK